MCVFNTKLFFIVVHIIITCILGMNLIKKKTSLNTLNAELWIFLITHNNFTILQFYYCDLYDYIHDIYCQDRNFLIHLLLWLLKIEQNCRNIIVIFGNGAYLKYSQTLQCIFFYCISYPVATFYNNFIKTLQKF